MKPITINQVNQGGIADSKYEGEANSVAMSYCLDIHSKPGLLRNNYKLKLDSGATITEFVQNMVVSSDGNLYLFSSESGKVWKKASDDTYSLVYTTAPTSGEAKCLGAAEFAGYIYWAVENHLYRVPLGSSTWSALEDAWVITNNYTENDLVRHNHVNYVATAAHALTRLMNDPSLSIGTTSKAKIKHASFSIWESGTQTDITGAEVAFTATTDDITANGAKVQEAKYLVSADGSTIKILKGTTADEGASTLPALPAGEVKVGEILIKVAAGATNFDATTDLLDAAHLTVTYTDADYTTRAETEPGVGTYWSIFWTLSGDTNPMEWGDFSITDDTYHPMVAFNNKLWIGDGNYVAMVLNNIFTAKALDLPEEQRIKTLDSIDIQLAIGSTVDNYVSKSTIYRWDTWSVSWNMDDTIEENGINAFIPVDNYFFVQAGIDGSIYSYDNNMLYLTKRITGDYSGTKASLVHPNAVAFFKGKPLFGVSKEANASATASIVGVYSYGTVNPRLYNRVINLEYVVSSATATDIGAIAVRGNDLYVSWKSPTATGVDIIDYANCQATAYLESRVIYLDRSDSNVYNKFVVGYVSMPTGCSIKAYAKQNYAANWTEITMTKDTIRNRYYSDIRLESNVIEFKVELIANEDDSPEVDYISLYAER